MKLNEEKILNYMVARKAFPGSKGVHRSSVKADLGMARTTSYDALKKLLIKGFVEKFKVPNGKKFGRYFVMWRLTTEELDEQTICDGCGLACEYMGDPDEDSCCKCHGLDRKGWCPTCFQTLIP